MTITHVATVLHSAWDNPAAFLAISDIEAEAKATAFLLKQTAEQREEHADHQREHGLPVPDDKAWLELLQVGDDYGYGGEWTIWISAVAVES